jgi:hypothetical protein
MGGAGRVTLEFFGVPRLRAGLAELEVEATTAAEALTAAERLCPGLGGLVLPAGRLAPHCLLSLDGRRFLTDLAERLPPGARLLLLSADAGG